jgi:hypothetical protein
VQLKIRTSPKKPGCCGSSELAIVAPAASWREIFWEKPAMGVKNKKLTKFRELLSKSR